MSIVVRHSPVGLTRAKYDEVNERLDASGDFPPDGMKLHILFGEEGDLRVSELWGLGRRVRGFRFCVDADTRGGWSPILRASRSVPNTEPGRALTIPFARLRASALLISLTGRPTTVTSCLKWASRRHGITDSDVHVQR